MTHDAVVLLGFGGPERAEEIRPFLDRVLEGKRIPPARYEEVVSHYERIGGRSPFNELAQAQADGLSRALHERGIDVPVETAFLNAHPFIDDTAQSLHERGKERPLAIVLAAFQSPASWQKYQRFPGADYAPPYFDRELFVQAQAQRVREALERGLRCSNFEQTALIFTAHSIPQAMDDASPYSQQYALCAELVAKCAGAPAWTIAYQSRSGAPSDEWLEPDVRDAIRDLSARGTHRAVIAPIGFLHDHVEVLYDLDVDAAATAQAEGVQIARAAALNDHPLFVRLLADLVVECSASP